MKVEMKSLNGLQTLDLMIFPRMTVASGETVSQKFFPKMQEQA